MTINTARFGLPSPEQSESPDGPSQLLALNDRLETVLERAGAQAKKSIVPAEQSRTNTAYGLLGTPDSVADIVLPTDGLIFVAFQAMWKSANASAGRAALFLDAAQVKGHRAATTPVQEAESFAQAFYRPLSTTDAGLRSDPSADSFDATSAVATGQLVAAKASHQDDSAYGGVAAIFADAGTYDVSVQFKATSGAVTVKERRLWVWTKAFA